MNRSIQIAVALTLAWPLAAAAAEPHRHSGGVVAVDRDAIVVEELGAGRAGEEVPRISRVEARIGPDTTFVVARRAVDPEPSGWPGGFVKEPVDPSAVKPGDFVTVVGRDDNGRLRAVEVILATPRDP